MAVANKPVISFGLVAIPISLYPATQDNDISTNPQKRISLVFATKRLVSTCRCLHSGFGRLVRNFRQLDKMPRDLPRPRNRRADDRRPSAEAERFL